MVIGIPYMFPDCFPYPASVISFCISGVIWLLKFQQDHALMARWPPCRPTANYTVTCHDVECLIVSQISFRILHSDQNALWSLPLFSLLTTYFAVVIQIEARNNFESQHKHIECIMLSVSVYSTFIYSLSDGMRYLLKSILLCFTVYLSLETASSASLHAIRRLHHTSYTCYCTTAMYLTYSSVSAYLVCKRHCCI